MTLMHILRVLKARLIIKTKIFFRYPLNIFYIIVDPIIWLSPFYFMSKAFTNNGVSSGLVGYTGSGDYIGFLVIGFMVTAYSGAALWSVGFSLKQEMISGVLESNWSAPVNRIVLILSNTVFEFIKVTIEIILTGIVCHFAFGFNVSSGLLKAIIFLIPGIIALMGIGLIVASFVLIVKNANNIVDISNAFINGLSGGYSPIQIFPKYLLPVCFAIPLTFMNDGTRTLLIGNNPVIDIRYEFILLVIFMLVFLILGCFVFNKIEKRCREKGLSGY